MTRSGRASRPCGRGYGWVVKVTAMHTASNTTPRTRQAIASSGAVPSPSPPRVIQLCRNHPTQCGLHLPGTIGLARGARHRPPGGPGARPSTYGWRRRFGPHADDSGGHPGHTLAAMITNSLEATMIHFESVGRFAGGSRGRSGQVLRDGRGRGPRARRRQRRVRARPFTAVMGPSGSGKSTLMHCMAGLDVPSSGRAFVGERGDRAARRLALTDLRRDRIGFVFQSFNLVPTLTAAENITLAADLAGGRSTGRGSTLWSASSGIADRLSHRPSELSGGQQQRVACARALIGRPELIFADEPTGNLDSNASAELLAFLRVGHRARAIDRDGHPRPAGGGLRRPGRVPGRRPGRGRAPRRRPTPC